MGLKGEIGSAEGDFMFFWVVVVTKMRYLPLLSHVIWKLSPQFSTECSMCFKMGFQDPNNIHGNTLKQSKVWKCKVSKVFNLSFHTINDAVCGTVYKYLKKLILTTLLISWTFVNVGKRCGSSFEPLWHYRALMLVRRSRAHGRGIGTPKQDNQ